MSAARGGWASFTRRLRSALAFEGWGALVSIALRPLLQQRGRQDLGWEAGPWLLAAIVGWMTAASWLKTESDLVGRVLVEGILVDQAGF
jgi:hypothetical protein